MAQKVALVLASGGARGIAHIGVIDELIEHGFEISSVAGTSMGALVGGIYCSGGLEACRKRLLELNVKSTLDLVDLSLGNDGLVKGQKVLKEIQRLVPIADIENLPIPFTAVATDLTSESEVVFDHGSLCDAIRSSISIPSVFKPYRIGQMALVDGGVVNPLPINRIKRHEGDILVVVDVNGKEPVRPRKRMTAQQKAIELTNRIVDRLNIPHEHLVAQSKDTINYYSLLSETVAIAIQQLTALSLEMYPPDILIRTSMKSCNAMEFYRTKEMIDLGRSTARAAIEEYMNCQATQSAPHE